MTRFKVLKLAIIISVAFMALSACYTTRAYKEDPKNYGALAAASCSDLQATFMAASAAEGWTRLYFPNREGIFLTRVDPLMQKVKTGLDAYCDAAGLVNGVDQWRDLLTKQREIQALLGDVALLVNEIKR